MLSLEYKKFLNVDRPILITGETGSGKSKMAREIFTNSLIHKENFLTLHIASIKEELIESELFGHKKGSFTGALDNKVGYLKSVGKGTLFIDEIGELSLESQKKLLYVLEEKEFVPVGETRPISFDGRLIFATNRNLKKMVEEKKFREDLYFRLMCFQIHLMPLKNQKDTLETMLIAEIQKHSLTMQLELKNFLMNYNWPGNFREFKNLMEFIIVMRNSNELSMDLLPDWIRPKPEIKNEEFHLKELSFVNDFHLAMENFEGYFLREVLSRNNGKVNQTAKLIGLSKSALIYKAKKHKINTLELRANEVGKLMNYAA